MFTPLNDFYYAGCMIKLTPDRQDDGQWGCRYSIIVEALKPKSNLKEGHVEADFSSSIDAEIAALKAAKCIIDSGIPLFNFNVQTEGTTAQRLQYRDYHSDGRTIKLLPVQLANGSWQCEYMLLEPGKLPTGKRRGSADGTFATVTEATAAALKKAKRVIS
ncbi:MAG: hypothetical protein H8K04_01735 [Nitrospira sp.]